MTTAALTRDQIGRLDRAEKKLTDLNPKTRDAGREEIARLTREQARRTEDAEAQAAVQETSALSRGRGEEFKETKVSHTKTRLRILSRDGLAYLYENGLAQRRYDAGMLYRRAYEGAQPRSTPGYGERLAPGDGSEAAAVRSECDRKRAEMEAVCDARRERTVLRLVAGEGRTIRSFARGGADRALYGQALLAALDKVADHNRLKRY
jgi:hypothetical protein